MQQNNMDPVALYYSAHFQEAAQRFLVSDDRVTKKRPRSSPSEDTHQNLTALAAEADAALCFVRASERTDESFPGLCQQALQAYERYCQKLDAVTISKKSVLTTTHKRECASSYLLATVSMSWLYLHLDNVDMSYNTLIRGMKWALSLLRGVERTSVEFMTLHEIVVMLQQELSVKHNQALQSTLHAMNTLNLTRIKNRPGACPRGVLVEWNNAAQDGHTKPAGVDESLLLCDTELERRSHLVEALHFHMQIQKDALNSNILRTRRNEWFTLASKEGQPGHCSKIRLLAQRLLFTLHALERLDHCQEETCLSEVEVADALCNTLGSSSSFAPFHNLLGCLRMRVCDASAALSHFEKAMTTDNRNIRQEVISNTAECFLQLGEPGRAVSLLFHLLDDEDQSAVSDEHETNRLSISNPMRVSQRYTKQDVLWRLYQAATLDGDDVTALTAAEELYNQQAAYADVAYVYSLLQTDRSSLALQVCAGDFTTGLQMVAMVLYKAEAFLLQQRQEQATTDRLLPSSDGARMITIKALVETGLNSYLQHHIKSVGGKAVDTEMKGIMYNNRGVIHTMEGEFEAAVICFRHACTIFSSIASTGDEMYLAPWFNLCCLLWQQHRAIEATNEWLPIRGLPAGENGFDLDSLTAAFACAYERNLKRSQRSKRSTDGIHIPKWKPYGLDPAMVTVLDMILMQCGIELANSNLVNRRVKSALVTLAS